MIRCPMIDRYAIPELAPSLRLDRTILLLVVLSLLTAPAPVQRRTQDVLILPRFLASCA